MSTPAAHNYTIYVYQNSKLLAPVKKIKLVYVPFGEISVHSKLDFCPRQAWKELNLPLHKRS